MKRYLFVILCGLFSFVLLGSAHAEESLDSTSCPVFSDPSANFLAQKSQMEYEKQQLKLYINNAYSQLHTSSTKTEKESLKDAISDRKKDMMLLNYRLFVLYKNEYLSRLTN